MCILARTGDSFLKCIALCQPLPVCEEQPLSYRSPTAASSTERKVLREQKRGKKNPQLGKPQESISSSALAPSWVPCKCVALPPPNPGGPTLSVGLPAASSSSLKLKCSEHLSLPGFHLLLSPFSLQCQTNLLWVRTPRTLGHTNTVSDPGKARS